MSEALNVVQALLNGFSRADWIAVGALLVSVYSVWQAARSLQVAQQANRLSLDTHRRSQPSLDLYVVEAFIRPTPTPPRRICVFKVRVSNQSDAPNGLKFSTLLVNYGKLGDPRSNLVIQHDPSCAPAVADLRLNVLPIPGAIDPRAVVGGAWLFPIPDDLIRGSRIDSYTVSLIDSYDREVKQEILLLREVRDAAAEVADSPDQTRG
jgi:hypothetical protein